ncbi:hypothetical protein AYO39_03195 [Actinobacteria bacterium SCGC AG-212-D09]|nr:hypothetical protein AYO39_03195 [Actinobacteria bacterium SCGC AG-212-D09]
MFLLIGVALVVAGCGGSSHSASPSRSYAIYGEYAQGSNKLMKNGLNRRVFNKVEAQSGSDATLNSDGSITLKPGTYHITGYSITTMQTTFAPPQPKHDSNYPGYALVYPVADESAGRSLVNDAIGIGSPQTALDATPSLFNLVYTTKATTKIAVGHQSGDDLNNEVYLSVYDVSGETSNYHVFARISIWKQ